MTNFLDYTQFHTKHLQLKQPTKHTIDNQEYQFRSLRTKNKAIYLKTPKLHVPFGLNAYQQYSISLDDRDIDPHIQQFYHFLTEIESFCQKQYPQHQFKSHFNDAKSLYRLKITPKLTEIYDPQDQIVPLDYLTPQCQTITLLEPNHIWNNTQECGLTWKIHQIKVYPSNRPLGGMSLLSDTITIAPSPATDIPNAPPIALPTAPPLAPPLTESLPRIPRGGIAILPFLSAISGGGFNLKKTEKKASYKTDNFPEISLETILDMRNRLKKTKPHGV